MTRVSESCTTSCRSRQIHLPALLHDTLSFLSNKFTRINEMSIFAAHADRATGGQIVVSFAAGVTPLSVIEEHGIDQWPAFLAAVSAHPAVVSAAQATGMSVSPSDIRYAVGHTLNPHGFSGGVAPPAGFSNRFDEKLFASFLALIAARKEAKKAREEHEEIMATRPPPTPPPEENHGGNDGAGGDYDDDNNQPGDGDDGHQDDDDNNDASNNNAAAASATAAPAPAPRPRKTRAQRKAEEQQKKDDAKRLYEVEVKEHKVACLEQKLASALEADAVRVSLAP